MGENRDELEQEILRNKISYVVEIFVKKKLNMLTVLNDTIFSTL